MPCAIPVSTPAADIVPKDGIEELHVPPAGLPVSVVVLPTHREVAPVIVPGADTDTTNTAEALVGNV